MEKREARRVSYEEQETLRQALSAMADAGTLTLAMLIDAIYTHHEDSDGPTESVGADWIFHHAVEFGRALGDGLLAFLREHMNAAYFLELLILSADVVALVPEAERAAFWRDAYVKKGARNFGWIEAARVAGISDSAIQAMILARLRAITPDMMRYANNVDEFLMYGDGCSLDCEQAIRIQREQAERGVPLVDRYRPKFSVEYPWGVLTDEQFVEALEICAQKSPAKLVSLWRKLMLRASREVVYRLCEGILSNASALSWSATDVRPFSLASRLALANKMEPVNGFALETQVNVINFLLDCFHDLLNFPVETVGAFWKNIERILEPANGAIVYRTMRRRFEEQPQLTLNGVVAIQAWLESFIERKDYKLGRIEEGTYRDRKSGQSRRQFQVWAGRTIYVQDRDGHRYFPRVGDEVLFRPASGRWLTPTVCAVHFIPVDPSRES